jgi:hypothetical protein
MNRYIVLYRAPLSVAERFAAATPEEAQEGLKLWVAWSEKLGDALLDPGKPLGNAIQVTPDGTSPTDSRIIGMSIVQAGSMPEALEMVKDHHHLHWAEDCDILVLEEMAIPELSGPAG